MFEVGLFNITLYAAGLTLVFYVGPCIYARRLIRPDFRLLFFYVTLFSLFGVVGEQFVNVAFKYLSGMPLWEYHMFPAHDGNVTQLFVYVWGVLGFYAYFRDTALFAGKSISPWIMSLVLGAEAIFIELLVNGSYYLLFNDYIFYYFPANLGPLSHFSCLQVVPFYMIVGLVTGKLIQQHRQLLNLDNPRGVKMLLLFYWFIAIVFVFL